MGTNGNGKREMLAMAVLMAVIETVLETPEGAPESALWLAAQSGIPSLTLGAFQGILVLGERTRLLKRSGHLIFAGPDAASVVGGQRF